MRKRGMISRSKKTWIWKIFSSSVSAFSVSSTSWSRYGSRSPRPPFRGALALRHERDLAPRHVVDLPLLVLGEVVEAEDARVLGARLGLGGDCLGAHDRDLILVA